MKRKLFFAAFAVIAFAACSKTIDKTSDLPEGPVEMEISVSEVTTKLTTVPDEEQVNNVQFFVFADGGKLEAYKNESNTSTTKMGIFPGVKIIHALVNAPKVEKVANYTEFCKLTTQLKNNVPGGFIMEGYKELTVGRNPFTTSIDVKRVVSRIILMKIDNQLDPIYGNQDVQLSRVYLTNVAGDRGVFGKNHTPAAPTKWFHKTEYVEDDNISSLTFDDVKDVKVVKGTPYISPHFLYCYPNPITEDSSSEQWSPRKTRLVAEVKIGGTLYYYPVTLNVTQQNTEYQVNLKITRPGSSDPDIPYNPSAATVSVNVANWASGGSVQENV